METIDIEVKESKICTRCLAEKLFSEFHKCKRESDGLVDACKDCCKKYNDIYRQNNKEFLKTISKRYWENHKDDPIFKEKRKQYQIKYCELNKEKVREYHRKRANKKFRTDTKFNLRIKFSNAIRQSLRKGKNGHSWETIVDYTLNDLIKYLQNLFTDSMSWEQVRNGNIVIDHILPQELFIFKDFNDPQFKVCWSLSNLQPLWKKDNDKKSDFLPDGRRARKLTKEQKLGYLKNLGYKF